MKKILIFIGGYLPARNYGGPVTSIVNLVDNLSDYYDFYIVTSNHDFNNNKILYGIHEGWNTVKNASVLYLNDIEFTYKYFVEVVKEVQPNCIYISSIFDYKMNLPIIKIAKKMKLPLIIAPRGELCENALKFGYLKKNIYLKIISFSKILKLFYFHATSEEEKFNLKKYLQINEKKIFLMPNMHMKSDFVNIRKKEKNSLKIIFISRIQQKKNLLTAIKIVNELSSNVVFDIYGPIEQKEYWDECLMEIKKSPSNIMINYCGQINPGDSNEVFPKYDCFLFPTFSENYGHVIAESIICNCPIIISKNTTPWDDIIDNGGFAIPLNEINNFVKVLNDISFMDEKEYMVLKTKLNIYKEKKLNTKGLVLEYINMFNKYERETKL